MAEFARWCSATMWRTVPTALDWTSVSAWLSRTPYWLRDGNPLGGHPWIADPAASLPETADVVVVGAGFGGASLAYHWSRLGSGSLVLLEKDDPASGAAGRNGGFVAPAGWYPGSYVYHPVERELRRVRSDLSPSERIAMVEAMASAYVAALDGSQDMIHDTIVRERIDCDYSRRGWVFAPDEVEAPRLRASLELAAAQSWPDYAALTPDQILQRSGMQTALPGSVLQDAGTWQPAKWVWGILQRALASGGVQLFTRTPAVNVERIGETYLVQTPRGDIRARHVVSAVEAYTWQLFADFLAPYRQFIQPHRSQGAYAEGRPPNMVLGTASSGPFSWFHPRPNGFAFGSDTSPIPLAEVPWNNPSRLVTLITAAEALRLWGDTSFTIYHEWSGSVALSPDNYPVIGSVDGHGMWICGAYAGAGSTCSFRGALRVIHAILGHDDEAEVFPDRFFSPARFHRDRQYGAPISKGD